jgi:hypothetical protein
MSVNNSFDLDIAAVVSVIQNLMDAVGMSELRRLTGYALQRADTVYILEYEGALLGPDRQRLSSDSISLFSQLKQHGVPVYILTEQMRQVIVSEIGEGVFTGIVSCANRESKASMVRIIKESHPSAITVCCGTGFMPLVETFRLRDFAYVVHDPEPGRFVRAYDMRSVFDTYLQMYTVPRRFVGDLMVLVLIKAIWQSATDNNQNSHNSTP